MRGNILIIDCIKKNSICGEKDLPYGIVLRRSSHTGRENTRTPLHSYTGPVTREKVEPHPYTAPVTRKKAGPPVWFPLPVSPTTMLFNPHAEIHHVWGSKSQTCGVLLKATSQLG